MKIEDLIVQLNELNKDGFGKRSVEDLVHAVFGSTTDAEWLFQTMTEIDRDVSPHLDLTIIGWKGKVRISGLSAAEVLMLKLRCENAIGQLSLLAQAREARVYAHLLLDDLAGHAVPWALVSLWRPYSRRALETAAHRFSNGTWTLFG